MRNFLLFLFSFTFLTACAKYDEEVLPVVGVYEAHVLGLTGPVSISVSIDHGEEIFIEAPFDGFEWIVVEANVNDKEAFDKEIKIRRQWVGGDVEIWGNGIYYDHTIQLDYTMRFGNAEYDYTLIGTKF